MLRFFFLETNDMICLGYWLVGHGHGGPVVGLGAFRPEGHRFESRSNRHVETLSKFLAHNALHYNCIWAADLCTSALLSSACIIIRKKGDIKGELYCLIVLYSQKFRISLVNAFYTHQRDLFETDKNPPGNSAWELHN